MFSIIAHGGAGDHEDIERSIEGVKKAVKKGKKILSNQGEAIDAVEETIKVLENLNKFNAGKGSVLSYEGEIEMEASLATCEKNIGAVTNVRDIKHPISLSRYVLEETNHVLIGGRGINELLDNKSFSKANPYTKKRIKKRKEKLRKLDQKKLKKEKIDVVGGTVGAAAIDEYGDLIAGTSTGGKSLKLNGRIGDSPIFGAGTYANEKVASSATGNGEAIIKALLTKNIALFREKNTLNKSLKKSIKRLEKIVEPKDNSCGAISVDKDFNISFYKNTNHMPVAYSKKDEEIHTTK